MSQYTICCESAVGKKAQNILEEDEDGCSRPKRLKRFHDVDPWDIEFAIEDFGALYKIRAHRRIVALSSPVFEAICRENPAGAHEPIQVCDVPLDAFEVMLNFMYGSSLQIGKINVSTACSTLLAAKKYLIPCLYTDCIESVTSLLNANNACNILEFALEHGIDDLARACCARIGSHASQILEDDCFRSCSLRSLLVILSLDSLSITSEAVVSDACMRWAEAQCLRSSLEPSRDNLRSALGPALGKIRFLSMTALQLIESSAFERLLTDEEARTILINVINPRSCLLPSTVCVDTRTRCD